MKTGSVFRDANLRWYEPQHALIGGKTYFTHAWGSIYVLSGHAAKTLALVSSVVPEGLRFFNNEGKAPLLSFQRRPASQLSTFLQGPEKN
jgi:hypothetical protein